MESTDKKHIYPSALKGLKNQVKGNTYHLSQSHVPEVIFSAPSGLRLYLTVICGLYPLSSVDFIPSHPWTSSTVIQMMPLRGK
jgi:hypothetical protein